MSNPNPYGQPGPNPGGQNPYSQQPNQPQPQSQFGQPGQPGQPGPAVKQGLQSLAWNQLAAGVAGIGALLVLLFSFFKWVGVTTKISGDEYTAGVNGWGMLSVSDNADKKDFAEDFGNTGLGVLFMLLTLGLLIAAAVMLWLKIQPRVAVYLGIAGGAVHLIWAIWTIVDFNGPYKEAKDELDAVQSTNSDYGFASDISLDGGPKFAVFLAIIVALAIIVLGVLAIVKFGPQLNVPGNNQPNQFGQPGNPQGQFGQPNQPNQQPQFGQPGNQNPFNQPGQ
ncbi:hypothetical protein COJE103337_06090 [Corynebacterium jeikeium]|uniref:hypothetical protein n=1 Tax=Corynebacterium jeikeium TaxID=38289 RepID=UPI0001B7179F|nr:hypothetical protein [Corynebacterium jeikeium]EEW16009.1 hypothetical protein HMPREF0297_1596 [Corynebacterium jeikeium ATCC 43734]OOD30384.1 hypothetical protein BWP03_07540 [Corynebacterium jeikeium]WCZ54346.1 hypothetical protein CJEIK_09260 [Corynebacterium jeikeium]SUY80349.1 Uncharacterised protein [Corynebacterium jeikeium]